MQYANNSIYTSKEFQVLSVCALLFVVSIPISTFLTSLAIILYITVWGMYYLRRADHRNNLLSWFYHPVSLGVLVLVVAYLISLVYSPIYLIDKFKVAKKIFRFLIPMVLMPVFAHARNRSLACKLFVVTILIIVAIEYVYKYFPNNIILSKIFQNKDYLFKDRIFKSLFVAISIYYMLIRINFKKVVCFRNVALFFLILWLANYLYFINSGRAGQIIGLFLFIMSLFVNVGDIKRIALKAVLIFSVLICVVIINLNSQENMIIARVNRAIVESKEYGESLGVENKKLFTNIEKNVVAPISRNDSSLGIRMEFMINSIKIFLSSPIFGSGAGSFPVKYKEMFPDRYRSHKKVSNPHNQYLLILDELGLIGLFIYMFLFYKLFAVLNKIPKLERQMFYGVLLAMVVGCAANSWLMDFTSSMFFITFLSIFSGAIPPDKNIISV